MESILNLYGKQYLQIWAAAVFQSIRKSFVFCQI